MNSGLIGAEARRRLSAVSRHRPRDCRAQAFACSFVRDPGLAQPHVKSLFEQRANLWCKELSAGCFPSNGYGGKDGRVTAQFAGFGEFGGRTFAVPFEAISGGERDSRKRARRTSAARLF